MTELKNSVSDPDSIRSVDPDSESGSRRGKMTHKSRKNLKFDVLKSWMFSFDSCGLKVSSVICRSFLLLFFFAFFGH